VPAAIAAAAAGWLAVPSRAQGGGQSFTTLAPGFTQSIFGVTGNLNPDNLQAVLGGVAFAPDGDVWSSECVFLGTRLHRFDRHTSTTVHTTPVHPETVVDLTATSEGVAGGCGLVNHPDGFLYSNSPAGLWKLDAETGLPVGPAFGPGGNALGIAVDPQSPGAQHLVYVGDDCHPTLTPDSTTCTLWDIDPASASPQVFARFSRGSAAFVHGIYFDPSGDTLFGTYREFDVDTGEEHYSLLVFHRPVVLKPVTAPVVESKIFLMISIVS
jgi:hypothetical protein